MSKWTGPIIDLLLEYVGHVQLCSKLTGLLRSREEWRSVERKLCKYQTEACLFHVPTRALSTKVDLEQATKPLYLFFLSRL